MDFVFNATITGFGLCKATAGNRVPTFIQDHQGFLVSRIYGNIHYSHDLSSYTTPRRLPLHACINPNWMGITTCKSSCSIKLRQMF